MPANTIYYSDKYYDERFEYRCALSPAAPNAEPGSPTLGLFARELSSCSRVPHPLTGAGPLLRRHVILPADIAKNLPKNLLSEREWRALGVQQSRGWVHYGQHKPEPHILLMRRPMSSLPDHLIPK